MFADERQNCAELGPLRRELLRDRILTGSLRDRTRLRDRIRSEAGIVAGYAGIVAGGTENSNSRTLKCQRLMSLQKNQMACPINACNQMNDVA